MHISDKETAITIRKNIAEKVNNGVSTLNNCLINVNFDEDI